MDASQFSQGIGVVRPVKYSRNVEKKPKAEQEQALNCPRCHSTKTKFCYYNNYSLSQPRYFCKTCRRYWTAGGTLRSVPVGGSSRKNRRSSSSSSSSSCSSISTKKLIPHFKPPRLPPQNPKIHDNDPPIYYGISELIASPFALERQNLNPQNPNSSLFETAGGLSSLVSNSVTSSSFAMHDIKPSLSFSLDGVGNRLENLQSTVSDDSIALGSRADANDDQCNSNGYWSMLFGSSW